MKTSSPEETADRSADLRLRRLTIRLGLLLCLLLFFWYPRRMDRLFRAIPETAELASFNLGLAQEWKHLTDRNDIAELLWTLGGDDYVDWRESSGVYHTLYWLTGRNSVFGLSTPEPGEGLGGIRLSGASYVGWKARPMELLWRICWIPGLGRLHVTPSGTRYFVFHRSKRMRRLGLVLSLDIFEGVLVGVLSNDPDAVCELYERVRYDAEPAEVFGMDKPWEHRGRQPHRFWLPYSATGQVDYRMGEWICDVTSLGNSNLEIRARGSGADWMDWQEGQRKFCDRVYAGGAMIAAEAPFLAGLLPAELVDGGEGWLPEGSRSELASVMATGKPFGGRLLGMALPALQMRFPSDNSRKLPEWAPELADSLSQWGKLGPVFLREVMADDGSNPLLLSFARAGLLGSAAAEDSPFMDESRGAVVVGTHLGSYLRQSSDENVELFRRLEKAWREESGATIWLWANLARMHEELRHLMAIYRLAARFYDSETLRTVDEFAEPLILGLAAAAALGEIEMTVAFEADGVVSCELRSRSVTAGM